MKASHKGSVFDQFLPQMVKKDRFLKWKVLRMGIRLKLLIISGSNIKINNYFDPQVQMLNLALHNMQNHTPSCSGSSLCRENVVSDSELSECSHHVSCVELLCT